MSAAQRRRRPIVYPACPPGRSASLRKRRSRGLRRDFSGPAGLLPAVLRARAQFGSGNAANAARAFSGNSAP